MEEKLIYINSNSVQNVLDTVNKELQSGAKMLNMYPRLDSFASGVRTEGYFVLLEVPSKMYK